uniref:Putative secreted peptide n=1 Tax=Anopheles braziliensis TaxID=58242 RepID=A0A2M3ZWM3_9DIPT
MLDFGFFFLCYAIPLLCSALQSTGKAKDSSLPSLPSFQPTSGQRGLFILGPCVVPDLAADLHQPDDCTGMRAAFRREETGTVDCTAFDLLLTFSSAHLVYHICW